MVEIYSYDSTTHERFARDQQEIAAFRMQYHVPPGGARFIANQAQVLDFIPKYPAVSLLFQTHQRKTWARFAIPQNFHKQRFWSSFVAPSLGNIQKQTADMQRLEAFLHKKEREDKGEDGEMKEEGELLVHFLKTGVIETNEMIEYIIGRMHQFIQA